MLWGFQTVALFFLEASSLLRAQTGPSHLLYNLLVITEIPDSLSPIRRNDPGVNHRLITITKQCLIPMICLSLHPIREILPSLLLPPAALCPLFNSAERPGTRGEQIDLLRGPYWQCLCCCGQCQALALHAWLAVRCWHDNTPFGQKLFLLTNPVSCLLVLLHSHFFHYVTKSH